MSTIPAASSSECMNAAHAIVHKELGTSLLCKYFKLMAQSAGIKRSSLSKVVSLGLQLTQ